ncbi:BREX-1 system phosphatase PglZ type B [Rubrobacter marinus]|uniref:BREX-1 system phosphatase PglZ type B n=1 Tax=Rubrobacter marinus TaxID=2653852 RepID=UPI00140A9960|nr:BREX-1 system phosphatase PglZ type B [Rubrobacter marinus]
MKSSPSAAPATPWDALREALRAASGYNRADVAPPAAVLWTDKERRWEGIVTRLRGDLPVLTLGPYAPDALTGPAIWLRCVIAGTLPEVELPAGDAPILYLPGVGRADLRAVEDCPRELQPLAELQYRGVLFTQKNARDWTPAALLQNKLGVGVSEDAATREALARSLPKLLDEPLASLEGRSPLNAAYLDELLRPDPERGILLWLDDPEGQRTRAATVDPGGWAAFRAICRSRYGFDPDTDGDVTAAGLLGKREGPWEAVWRRFAEAPTRYPNLPGVLDRARPHKTTLFESSAAYWPGDNREEENRLRASLLGLPNETFPREALLALEAEHGERRGWVWAELGRAPLAHALLPLAALARAVGEPHGTGDPAELAEHHASGGWKADRAALEALASAVSTEDSRAVQAAVEAVYRPWLEECARRFQEAVAATSLPSLEPIAYGPEGGLCLLFTDGLRYDVAQRLAETLEEGTAHVERDWRFSALPGVTATAKPALSPAGPLLSPGKDFDAVANGSRVTADGLRRLLTDAGYQVLKGEEVGSPDGSAWTEFGDLDATGHRRGWKMALDVERSVRDLAERILELLEAGWPEVRVVTDHGWLLLPYGLPKVELPQHLTVVRKGRCARLKGDSSVDAQAVPWTLDPEVRVVVAPGIRAYEAGKEYEHGGLSPQECVVPVLTVTAGAPATAATATIAEIRWTGLRCRVRVEDAPEGARVDLRSRAADPSTSIAPAKTLKGGAASLPVADDSREFEAAILVVLDPDGRVLAQRLTTVGG